MESIRSCFIQLHALIVIFTFIIVLPIASITTTIPSTISNDTRASDRASYARLLSNGPPLSCTYQGRKYPHGEEVITSEPCLNCTCKRGVLLCFLRVCPSLIHLHIDENCETIREPGQCCPTVRCTSRSAPVTMTTDPTGSWPEEREEPSGSGGVIGGFPGTIGSASGGGVGGILGGGDHDSQTTPYSTPQEVANSLTSELNGDFDSALRKKLVGKGNNNRIVVTHRDEATVFQTNPTTVFHDSPKLVTSSPGHYSYSKDDIDNFPTIFNKINRDCYLNSTLYAEGSAVMSSSYCEYCYCIRGKKMCIRPRCHLAILGCIPRYTSEYACCPTSYICGNSPNPSISLDERTLSPSGGGFTPPVKLLTVLPSTSTTTSTTTTRTTTTTTTTTTPRTPSMFTSTSRPLMSSTSTSDYAFSRKVCRVNGIIYQLGDHVPSDVACQNCYCSYGGVKRCKKIHCSPVMEDCIPIIPEGHCCPVEYKCHGGTKARVDTSLEKEISITDDSTTTELPLVNSTSQPWLVTSSDIDIATDPSDSDLVESTSVVSVALKSADLIKDSHLSGIDGQKSVESVDRPVEFGKAIDKHQSISLLSLSPPPPTPVSSASSIVHDSVDLTTQSGKNAFPISYSGPIEARSSIDSDPTELVDDIDVVTTPASSSTTSSPTSVSPQTSVNTTSTTLAPLSSSTTTPAPSSTTVTPSPPPITTTKKPNNSWFRLDGQGEPDGVGLLLGGIIEALERRIQSSLPAESRLPLDKKETILNDFNKVKKPADESLSLNVNNQPSNQLPDFYGLVQPNADAGGSLTSNKSESHKLNETINAEKPVVGTIIVKPEAGEHLKYSGAALDPGNVEIITAATPFLHDIGQPDSILVNLSSSSFKVSTDEVRDSDKTNHSGPAKPITNVIFGTVTTVNLTNSTDFDSVKPPMMYNFGHDEWKVINHNHRPTYKNEPTPYDHFGIKYRSEDIGAAEDFDLTSNSTDNIDKKSRSEMDSEISSLHPGYSNNHHYMSFGPGDVSTNFPHSHVKPNSSFSIRLPTNRKPSTNQHKQIPVCRINDQEYTNGAIIPQKNLCVTCRCFYGRELCHQQRCSPPPSPDCKLEYVKGFCCPRYICINPNDTSLINPAIAMNPGLQPFQKPNSPQLSHQVLPVQPPKLGYIPLSGLPVPAESEIHKETVAPPLMNNLLTIQRPNSQPKDRLNVTGSPLAPTTDLSLINSRPKPQTATNQPPLNGSGSKNRIHFPIGKPEPSDSMANRNITNGSIPQGSLMLPSRLPNLLPHIFKQSTLLNNNIPPQQSTVNSIGQTGLNMNRQPSLGAKKPSWPSSLGPQVRPGPQNKPLPDINRFPTIRPELPISTTSFDSLRITKTTTEKNIQPPSSTFNLSSLSSSISTSTLEPLLSSSLSSSSSSSSSSQPSISTTIKPVISLDSDKTPTIDSPNIIDPFLAKVLDQTGSKQGFKETIKPEEESELPSPPSGMGPSPWDALRVSGCNIYGTFYKVDQPIDKLSSTCKKCFCSSFGVQCNKVC